MKSRSGRQEVKERKEREIWEINTKIYRIWEKKKCAGPCRRRRETGNIRSGISPRWTWGLGRSLARRLWCVGGIPKKAEIPAGPISVNLSTFCAGTKGLAGEEDLLFEITETAKEEEENREIWRFAKQLREEGFRIAMDDYGMGRSTLKMLCQVPFDILKLDRYFISRIGEERGETILKSTIALAKDLGMEIVAEGLESREQIAFLLRHGCRLGQGYYYARPLERDRYFQFRAEGKRLPEGRR